jgi:propionate CoA-transferase
MRNKVITADEAAKLIKNGDMLGTVGFVRAGHPEELSMAVEKRFLETGEPNGLTLYCCAGQSNGKDNVGANRLCKEKLLKRVVLGHLNLLKDVIPLINGNKLEAYNLPQGVMLHLLRAIASKKPGVITPIGLKTFVDPRLNGGKLNSVTTEDIVELVKFDGKEYLRYKPHKLNVGFIRGTYADEKGNLTWGREALKLEHLTMALAVKACGGIVIAQVEAIAKADSFDPHDVLVPGVLVDYVVVASTPEYHMQTGGAIYEPWLNGDIKIPLSDIARLPLDERKVACRRAALELTPDSVINLGIGMPEGVGAVFAEEDVVDLATGTVESGPIGGVACGTLRFGASVNLDAFMEHTDQFNLYDGGCLDLTVLGMAELDAVGNVNVSKFGPRIAGAGGFINISQSSKKVVFMGTFTAGGFKCEIKDGKLVILQEGKIIKFKKAVEHVTFSGDFARENNLNVLFITERAVFTIGPQGLTLIEIAPGIDLEKDVLANMEFKPIIAKDLKTMDPRIFADKPMNIRAEIMAKAAG